MRLWLIVFVFLFLSFQGDAQDIQTFGQFEQMYEALPLDESKVVVVNFWATWCKPCVEELVYFNAIENMALEDVNIFLISLDMIESIEDRLLPFLEKNKLLSQVYLLDDPDANAWINQVDASWSGAIPATVFYYRGQKLFKEGSFHNKEEILNYINNIKTIKQE